MNQCSVEAEESLGQAHWKEAGCRLSRAEGGEVD